MARSATDTREHVITAARNLFSGHGYSGTSLNDILDAVGITKGAFYYYFKSKDALCEIVLEEAIEEYHHLAEAALDSVGGTNGLIRWLTLIVQQNTEGQWLNLRLLARLTIECPQLTVVSQERLSSFWRWYQGFYETLIRQSLGQDGPNNEDIPLLARSLMCSLFGALWLDRCAAAEEDLVQVAQLQLRQLLK